jgi:energy-coupling factor transporter ATP-binding protein EcfA2
MRLVFANFNNVLGLNGNLCFEQGRPLLIYGDNISGKSNIVNILRYCLIPKFGREKKGYAEEKRLTKNEILLEKNSTGSVEIYFEQLSKLYKLHYSFSRKSKSVGQVQKVSECDKVELPTDDEKRIQLIRSLKWKDLDISSPKSFKEKLIEIGIYPEVLDILISASNVRNFSEAVNGSVVKVPEIVAAKISRLHDNCGKYLDNLNKLAAVLATEKDEFENRIRQLKAEFEDASRNLPEIKADDIFIAGNIVKNVENVQGSLSKELEAMPKKTGDIEKTLALLSSEKYEIWTSAIDKIIAILSKKEKLNSLLSEEQHLKTLQESLSQWKIIFERLPPDSSPESITVFAVPNYEKFDFGVFSNPDRVKSLFEMTEKAKQIMQTVGRTCEKHKVLLKAALINEKIKSYDDLLKVLKNPAEASGDPALISRKNLKTVVSIPFDLALTKPEYLKDIEPIPLIHKPERLDLPKFNQEILRAQKSIVDSRNELRSVKNNLAEGRKLLSKIRKIRDSLNSESEAVKKRGEKVNQDLERLANDWRTAYHHLCEVFKLESEKIDLSCAESVDLSYGTISETYAKAQRALESDLMEHLKNYPQELKKYEGQKPIDIVKGIISEFKKRIEEMTRLQNEYKKVNEWILLNVGQIKSLENRNRTAEITNVGLTTASKLLTSIHGKADVKKIIEELAEKIEINVKDAYSEIFPEDNTFVFEHLEKGHFLSMINNEPITHPSGSQRVAISTGIMLSLGETFGLPILLDEAFDRIDANRLRFFTEYITGISASSGTPQICLAGFTTFNIEKNTDVLNFVNSWKLYMVKRAKALEKNIEMLKEIPSG